MKKLQKMKKIKILFLSLAVFFASSCGEDFLQVDPSGSLTVDGAIASVEDMEAVLLGAYDQLQNSDWYGRYFVLVPDVMSDDVKQNSSANRAKEWAEYSGNPLDFISEEIWTEVYEGVNRANAVINAEVDFPPEVQAEADQLIGEALALRALAHFDICRIYAQHYGFSSGASHPGIPYTTVFDEKAEPSRLSVGEIYTNVIADLNAGIAKMNTNRGTEFMSTVAAQALLARVFFYQEDYRGAEDMATTVINSSEVSLTDYASYLGAWAETGSAPDVIFETVMTEMDNNGGDALGRMYINEGYGDLYIGWRYVWMGSYE